MRYVRRLGGLSSVLAVDEQVLSDSGLPAELKPFALEFDGERTVLQRILADSMNDLTSLRLTSKLVEQGVLVDPATLKKPDSGSAEAVAASWLEGNSGSSKIPDLGEDDSPEAAGDSRQSVAEEPAPAATEEDVADHFGEPTQLPTGAPTESTGARRMKAATKMRMTPRMRRPRKALRPKNLLRMRGMRRARTRTPRATTRVRKTRRRLGLKTMRMTQATSRHRMTSRWRRRPLRILLAL